MIPSDLRDQPTADVFQRRRARVCDALGESVMVLSSAPVTYRSRDTEHAYRPDSELYYLTGLTDPGIVAVLVGGAEPRTVLFVPARDPSAELWGGRRLAPEESAERAGAERAESADALDSALPGLLAEGDVLHVRLGRDDRLDRAVVAALAHARARGPRRGTGPRGTRDPGEILDEMRLVKEPWEIERIRLAVAATLEGHRAARAHVRPGVGEWVVAAEVEAAFRRAGAAGPAFATIVGSGPNAGVLHYVENGRTMEDGDLVLVDAGAEVALYAGDVTRTFAVSGTPSAEQRAVHAIVDRARAEAVAVVRPGATIADVHAAALRVMTEGLREAGVLSGSLDELLEGGACTPFFPHQTSHWLGLDVHDPGDYAKDGRSRVLEPGMVFTVEPGLYFRVEDDRAVENVPDAWRGIGVRIEDDVLVTEDGVENLTASLSTDPGAA